VAELAALAPGCTTRFLVAWSRMDQMVVPQRNARLLHPDLNVEELELRDVGHLALPIAPRSMHRVVTQLAHSEVHGHPFRRGHPSAPGGGAVLDRGESPAS
jgi:hypothetical protein